MKIDRSVLSPKQLRKLEKSDRARLGMASFAEERKEATKDQTPPPGKDRGPRERKQHVDATVERREHHKEGVTSVAVNRNEDHIAYLKRRIQWFNDNHEEAARHFHKLFRAATRDVDFAKSGIERIDGSFGPAPERYVIAADLLRKRINALHKLEKSIIINMIGIGKSFKDWSQLMVDGGEYMDVDTARGILRTALDRLVKYEGLA